jgi:PAS domain S-box-containing protein
MTQPERRFNILLVDDRPENLVALEAALAGVGENVVRATSGQEALRLLLKQEFEVILLDVNMPGMSGFDTAELIRQRQRTAHTPIIFVTAAMSSETHLARGYALGAVDYLFTPVEPEILRAKVATFIDLARKAELQRTRAEEERIAAETRAAVLESRLLSLFNRLDVGIFRATLDGRLVDANPALLRLLGFPTLEEAREEGRWREHGVHPAAFLGSAGGEPREEAFELHPPDGRPLHVSVTKTWSLAPGGARHVEGLVTDISKRRAAEEERERLLASERTARDDAERANRVKDDFLATLSHELRTPLNAILGWAELLRQSPHDAQERQLGLDVITRNARMQTRLINDLLDMSRITSGKVFLDLQSVALAPVIDGVIESFQPQIEAKGLRVGAVLDPACEAVEGDPARLQQIVWNLLSNAIKFSRKSGFVQVALSSGGGLARFTVIDDGDGIDSGFLPQVFHRFQQADASSTRRHGGLGLGLAIVKHLVEMHGGTVSAASEGIGKGARFEVVLPTAGAGAAVAGNAAPAAPATRSADAAPPRLDGVRVLVVDDAEDARGLLRAALERHAASVTTVESAPLALEAIARELPDVLVSDIGMPQFDGYQLIERVRALPPGRGGRLPAAAITSFVRAEDRLRALEAGYDEFMVKPVEPRQLVQVVAKLAQTRARAAAVGLSTFAAGQGDPVGGAPAPITPPDRSA